MKCEGLEVELSDVAVLKQGKYIDNIFEKSSPSNPYPAWGGGGIRGYTAKADYDEPVTLITCRGSGCGLIQRTNSPSSITNSIIGVSIDDKVINSKFFFYLALATKFSSIITGSAQPQITLGHLGNLKISVPPLRHQHAIASILSSLDDKIENNRRMNETLEGMAQAIFKSWFVDFDPVHAKAEAIKNGGNENDARLATMQAISGQSANDLARLQTENPSNYTKLATTANAFPSTLTNSPLGLIPEGWKVQKIENVINRQPVGKKFSSKTASSSGKVPILDQGKSGLIGYHDDESGLKASPEDPVIVFANHTCYMRLVMYDFSAIQNVLPFKSKLTHILWLYYATLGKQSFVEYKGHWPDFVIKKIAIPTKNLDSIFAGYISQAIKKIYKNELENQTLAETRDALLPKLLSGDIEDLNNE